MRDYKGTQHICQVFIDVQGKTVCKECGNEPFYKNKNKDDWINHRKFQVDP